MQRTSTVHPSQAHAAQVETVGQDSKLAVLSPNLRTLGLGLALLLLALLVLVFGYGAVHNGRVFRGVSVLGKDLGGMSADGARVALSQAASGYPSDSVA